MHISSSVLGHGIWYLNCIFILPVVLNRVDISYVFEDEYYRIKYFQNYIWKKNQSPDVGRIFASWRAVHLEYCSWTSKLL
jgi:uncharacterized protein YqhQ